MSVLTLTLLFAWPRIPGRVGRVLRTVPAALVAVAGATLTASLTGLVLPKVDLPSWSSHALAGLPEGEYRDRRRRPHRHAGVQCAVTSRRRGRGQAGGEAARANQVGRSDLNRELLGQGAANVVSGALSRLPIAGWRCAVRRCRPAP